MSHTVPTQLYTREDSASKARTEQQVLAPDPEPAEAERIISENGHLACDGDGLTWEPEDKFYAYTIPGVSRVPDKIIIGPLSIIEQNGTVRPATRAEEDENEKRLRKEYGDDVTILKHELVDKFSPGATIDWHLRNMARSITEPTPFISKPANPPEAEVAASPAKYEFADGIVTTEETTVYPSFPVYSNEHNPSGGITVLKLPRIRELAGDEAADRLMKQPWVYAVWTQDHRIEVKPGRFPNDPEVIL